MNKKILTAAVAAAMIAPLAAQAAGEGPTIYGVAHIALEHWDHDTDTVDDKFSVNSRQSRFGIKGSEDLGNGLSAIYKMEWQVDLDGDSTPNGGEGGPADRVHGGDELTSRNMYVGLAHKSWGTILMGRHDTPKKFMTISRDKFNTQAGDWNEVCISSAGCFTDRRVENAILYKSPNFSGFEAAILIAPGEGSEAKADGKPRNDDLNDAVTSIGARYVNGPLYIGAAWEQLDEDSDGVLNSSATDDVEEWRIAASYQIGDFNIGAVYEDQESVGYMDDVDADIWQISASYKFGNTVVKAMYQEGEQDAPDGSTASDREYDAFAIGVDHSLSKRTKVYAQWTETSADGSSDDMPPSGLGFDDRDAFSMGIIHKF